MMISFKKSLFHKLILLVGLQLFIAELSAQDINITTTPTCQGVQSGQILLNVVTQGYNPPFEFEWKDAHGLPIPPANITNDPIAGISIAGNLAAGNYYVIVTTADGCKAKSCNIVVEALPSPIIESITPTCICPNGFASPQVTITGGNANDEFTYFWSSADPNSTWTWLGENPQITTPGHYILTVLDNTTQCEASESFSIDNCQPQAQNFDISINHSCEGPNTGSIVVDLQGSVGAGPYDYKWFKLNGTQEVLYAESTSNSGVATLTDLGPGTYCFSVKSMGGCEVKTCGLVVGEYAPPIIDGVVLPESVPGAHDGSITLTSTGGASPIKYKWSNGSTLASISNLAAGNYAVTVSHGNHCTTVYNFEVHTCAVLLANINPVTEVYAETSASPATIDLTITSLYGYDFITNWTSMNPNHPFTSTTEDITPPWDGLYCVDISFAACLYSNTVCDQICDFPINIEQSTLPQIQCNSIQITAITDEIVTPVIYEWVNSADPQTIIGSTQSIIADYDQEYCVTVTNGTGCNAKACYTPTIAPINLQMSSINATFGNSNGRVGVNVEGGLAPYYFLWNDTHNSDQQTVSDLPPGEYCVTVTDMCGNTASGCVNLQCEFGESILSANITPLDCSAGPAGLGAIDLTVTPPFNYVAQDFTYNWGNNVSSQDRASLRAGEYCVTVTHVSGCTATACYTIPTSSGTYTISFQQSGGCYGGHNGIITALPTGGAGAYTYNWSAFTSSTFNGTPFTANSQTIQDLEIGWYTVTVTDKIGCTASATTFIYQPAPFTVEAKTIPNPICDGGFSSAELVINGFTEDPLSYTWYNWAASPQSFTTTEGHADGLVAGYWGVSVTDATGCIAPASFEINTFPEIQIIETIRNDCAGDSENTGFIKLAISGGTPPYSILWENGQSDYANRYFLSAGNYAVTVTDSKNCISVEDYTLIQSSNNLDLVVSNIVPTSSSCTNDGGATVNFYGGGPNYSIELKKNGIKVFSGFINGSIYNFTGLGKGNYSVLINEDDNNPCTSEEVPFIIPGKNKPAIILVDFAHPCGDPNKVGHIDIEVEGGDAPYTYAWTQTSYNGVCNTYTTQDISWDFLACASFHLTVTDSKGCTVTRDFHSCECTINGFKVDIIPLTLNCASNSSSILRAEPNYGNDINWPWGYPSGQGPLPEYYYSWTGPNGFQSNEQIVSVNVVGEYCVTVTDNCYRQVTACYEINCTCENPSNITFEYSIDDCANNDPGYIEIKKIFPTPNHDYFIFWNHSGVVEIARAGVNQNNSVAAVFYGTKKQIAYGPDVWCVKIIDATTGCSSKELCFRFFGDHTCFYSLERPHSWNNDIALLNNLNDLFPGYNGNFINRCGLGDPCENPNDDWQEERFHYVPNDCKNKCKGGGTFSCTGCGSFGDGNKYIDVPANNVGYELRIPEYDHLCYCVFPPGLIDDPDMDFLLMRTAIDIQEDRDYSPYNNFYWPTDPFSAGIVVNFDCSDCEPNPNPGGGGGDTPYEGPNCSHYGLNCPENEECLITPNPSDCTYNVYCSGNPEEFEVVEAEFNIVYVEAPGCTEVFPENPEICNLILMYQCPFNPCFPAFSDANVLLFTEVGLPVDEIEAHFNTDVDCGEDSFCSGEEIKQIFDEAVACPGNIPIIGGGGNEKLGYSHEISKFEIKTIENDFFAKIYPNPFSHKLEIEIETNKVDRGHIVISNSVGTLIERLDLNLDKGINKVSWNPLLNNVPFGLYHVQIINENGNQISTKVIFAPSN